MKLLVAAVLFSLPLAAHSTAGDCTPNGPVIGTSYCPNAPSCTGIPALTTMHGSQLIVDNVVTLHTTQLPANSFGYYLVSSTEMFVQPPLSNGFLCVGPSVGRYNTQVQSAGATGCVQMAIDLNAVPTPSGGVAPVQSGDFLRFQYWYRDCGYVPARSNFSDAVRVRFL